MSSKGSIRYQEILANKQGVVHSKTTAPALEFIAFMKTKQKGFEKVGASYVSTIRNGFLVRYERWNRRLYDVTNSDGVLMFINKRYLRDAPVKPISGTFDDNAIYDDVIKAHLREKKLLRVLKEFGFEE